jgi:pimeloyl-ACP methyl ester carboxylesterase
MNSHKPMKASKTKVYFVPGLAAGEEIFRNIKLPEDDFEVHIIPWLIPKKKESLSFYAKRMTSFVKDENTVLIGVSFGGVVVQEMSLFLNLKKLIIISSVKTKYELPSRLKWVARLKAYNLLPTRLILSARDLTKLAIGPRSRKRLKIYDEYLHVRDKQYLDWAIKNMVCWNREEALPQVYHIHGDEDIVFPIKNINHAIVIPGGNHIMLLTKGVKVSEKIIEILRNN